MRAYSFSFAVDTTIIQDTALKEKLYKLKISAHKFSIRFTILHTDINENLLYKTQH